MSSSSRAAAAKRRPRRRRRRFGARRLRPILLAIVAGGVTALAIVAYEAELLRSLELSTVNTRFQVRGPHKRPRDVVLVKIDDTTFSELPREQWPYRRSLHAQVIEDIARDHPSVIAYDVQFSEASTLHEDSALASAMLGAGGRTVMAATETQGHGESRFLGTLAGPLLHELRSRAANALFPLDPGGVDRRLSYEVGHLKTLAVVSAEVARGRDVRPSLFGGHSAWIDYYGPAGTFSAVSFSTVLRGRVPRGFFHNKIVVIGASVPSLHDVAPTSTSSQMPGVEIQANAIETVLRGLPLRSLEEWLSLVLIVLLAVIVPALSIRTWPPITIAAAVVLAAALTVGAQLAFNGGHIIPFVYSAGALLLSTGGALSVQLVTIAFERERVRDLFSRFVPENVVDEVLASADHGLRLGGVQREGTVMFTDLRGFTSFAESLAPDQVIDVLNRYLSEMSDAILDHGGTLVAYMGDGIMAVFGAPIAQSDHADRALAAAREMLTVRLPRFNAWLEQAGLGSSFRMGIGLNSGSVMSGNVGSERRVEYTAVGDTTNAAARIEQLTKGTPHQLMLSGATKEALADPPADLVFVQDVELRGRSAGTAIWSLAEGDRPAATEEPAGQHRPPSR
jgi:adenylate cyclase